MKTKNDKADNSSNRRLKAEVSAPIKNMLIPVTCNYCNTVYDLTKAKIICRHLDCTVFKTPCCKKTADDREWKSAPDFRKYRENEVLINGEILVR